MSEFGQGEYPRITKSVSVFFLRSKKPFLFFVAVLFFTCLLRLPIFYTPILDIDESIFGTVAMSLVRGGKIYIDIADIKPPFIFWFYAAIFKIFGNYNMLAIHFVTVLWIVLTASVVGKITKLIMTESESKLAILFYVTITSLGESKLLATSINILMTLPIALSFYFFLDAELNRGWWRWVTAGLIGATASLFRVQGGIIIVIMGLCILVESVPFRQRVFRLLLLTIGAIVAYIPVYIYLSIVGAVDNAIFWNFILGFKYASQGETFAFWPRFLFKTSLYTLTVFPFLTAAVLLAYKMVRNRSCSKQFFYLAIWFLLTWWPVCMGRRFYGHYFLMLAPPLAVMASYGFLSIKNISVKRVFVGLIILWTVVIWLTHFEWTGLRKTFHMNPSDWLEVETLQCPIGKFIKAKTEPSDVIFVWGLAPSVYFCSQRMPSSRFFSADAIVGRTGGGNKFRRRGIEQTELGLKNMELWDQLFSDFSKRPPVYIVDVAPSDFGSYAEYPLEAYPLHDWMMKRGYEVETEVNKAKLYRLRRLPTTPP